MDLLSFLQSQKVVSPEIAASVTTAAENNTDLETALVTAGVEKAALRTQIAAYYGIPSYTPDENIRISPDVLEYIPLESAQHYEIIPLKVEDGVLLVGVNDPEDLRVREVLSFVSSKYGIPYKFAFILREDLLALLKSYENLTGEVDQELTSLESELDAEVAVQLGGSEVAEVFRHEGDADQIAR